MTKLKKILQFALGIFLIVILFSLIDIQEVYRELTNLNPGYYLLAVLIFLSIYLWSSMRWKILAKSIGYDISLMTSFKIIAIAYGLNKILPLNSGDLARSKIMEKYTPVDKHGEIVGIVAIERLLDVAFLILIIVIASLSTLKGLNRLFWIYPAAITLIALIFSLRYLNTYVLSAIDYLKIFKVSEKITEFLKDGLKTFNTISNRELGKILTWHSLRWISGIAVTYTIAISLGIPLSFMGSALETGVTNLASVIPATPAGLGISELSGVSSLVILGLSSSEATSIIILERILALTLMPIIGYLVYTKNSFKIE